MINNEGIKIDGNSILTRYTDVMERMLIKSYPDLTTSDINAAVDYSINKRYKEETATISNNYKNKNINMNLMDITNYILDKQPIVSSYGVLWNKKGTVPNPLSSMILGFLKARGLLKDEMFKHKPGSELFERFSLGQVLEKVNVNAIYGACGCFTSIFYNLHVAASVTAEGRSLLSAAGLCFEMFLSNNVKFGSLNEIITFIDNIIQEAIEEKSASGIHIEDLIDRNITVEECFYKIVMTCGFEWIPDEDDLQCIYDLIYKLDQETINRIYYKNNLFEFVDNAKMTAMLVDIFKKLGTPFINPNEAPKEIEVELNLFLDILMDHVYYKGQIIDGTDRMENMIRNNVLTMDTDSCFVYLDAWFQYCLTKIVGLDLPILHQTTSLISESELDDFGDTIKMPLVEFSEPELDYDFYSSSVIQLERPADMLSFIPQDGLMFSAISIMSYVVDHVVNDYVYRFCKANNTIDGKCIMKLKNEFTLRRMLLTSMKKNYADIQVLQEGKILDNKKDIKGLAIDKSSQNESTREALKKILFEDILKSDEIDQIKVLKHISILEDNIFKSLSSGSKDFYKPITIKSINSYEDIGRISGMKAAIAYNGLRGEDDTAIDLDERNSLDIVKTDINPTNIYKVKEKYPEVYLRLLRLVGTATEPTHDVQYATLFKGAITAIALPADAKVPEWLLDFIDYNTIINDNVKNFPLESIGISRLDRDNVNKTNIISF